MRFLHSADWHLGRVYHGVSLLEDQAHVLQQFVRIAADTRPDAILLAGDIYDRSVPPAEAVRLLSDLEVGSRVERKAYSRARLASAPAWVQTIKCADLISNTSSIVLHDPKFAVTYLAEKRALLEVLTLAHPALRRIAMEQATC